jgi:hypothetical protein
MHQKATRILNLLEYDMILPYNVIAMRSGSIHTSKIFSFPTNQVDAVQST